MHAAPGIGLAANQVGVDSRVAVVDLSVGERQEDLLVLVNPELLTEAGEEEDVEGCLSIPDFTEKVTRPLAIKVRADDLDRQAVRGRGRGPARARDLPRDGPPGGHAFTDRLRGLRRERARRMLKRLEREQERRQVTDATPRRCCSLSPSPSTWAAAVVVVEEAAVRPTPPTPTPPTDDHLHAERHRGRQLARADAGLERPDLAGAVARGDLGHRPLRRRVRPAVPRRRARVRRGHRGHLPRPERQRRHLAAGGGVARRHAGGRPQPARPGARTRPGRARCCASSSPVAPPARAIWSSPTTRRSTPPGAAIAGVQWSAGRVVVP